MFDFSIMELKALKIAWINRVQNESSASWKTIPNYLLRHHGNLAFLSNCNYDTKTLKLGNLPDFYCSFLEYWQYVKNTSIDETDPKHEILWNNCNMLIDKMSVFYKNWFTHNIIHLINDFLNEHSNFYKFHEFKAKYNFDALSLSSMAFLTPFLMRGKIKLNGKTKMARLIKTIIQHLTQVQINPLS